MNGNGDRVGTRTGMEVETYRGTQDKIGDGSGDRNESCSEDFN